MWRLWHRGLGGGTYKVSTEDSSSLSKQTCGRGGWTENSIQHKREPKEVRTYVCKSSYQVQNIHSK